MNDVLAAAKNFSLGIARAQTRRLSQRALVPGGHKSSCWPKKSYALGCNASQIKEVQATLTKAGVAADFNKDGTVNVTSQAHQTQIARALGMIDYNAGYNGSYDTDEHKRCREAKQVERRKLLNDMGMFFTRRLKRT